MNFLTLSFLKSLIQVQLGKSRRLIPKQSNKVAPLTVVKVKLDEEQGLSKMKDPDTGSWSTRRRSSSSKSPRLEDLIPQKSTLDEDVLKSDEELLPGPGAPQPLWDVILDLSAVTWLDDTGCSLVTWVAREQRLAGLVLPQHLEVRTFINYLDLTDPFLQDVLEKWTGFQKIKCIIYPTLSDAIRLAVD